MKKTILLLAFASMTVPLVLSQTVTFTTSNAVFPNPERGFYHQIETAQAAADFTQLSVSSLSAMKNGRLVNGTGMTTPMTLVLRLYYINDFKTADFSPTYLTNIRNDMTAARTAGVKLILRFAYSNQNTTAPFNASKAQILTHINQLKPIFQDNSDVIATVQMGFIGAWGENWTTTGFGIPPLNATYWQDRKDVFDALLAAVPASRAVQVRAPHMKQKFVDGVNAPTTSTAQNARIGHHNDCFLANYSDEGTYNNYSTDVADTTTFKAYLATDAARGVPIGGETCGGNYLNSNCLSAGGQVENELKRLHYSFINADWSPTTLGSWTNCLDAIAKRLGYRFALVNATYPTAVTNSSALNIEFSVRNDGFATPYNQRKVEFILRNATTNDRYYALVNTDPRQWQVDATTTVNESFCLNSVPNGTYDVLLNLPDASPTIYTNPNYAIQLANTSVWESTTGYNKLSLNTNQRIVVSGSGGTCATNLTKFNTYSAVLPLELINFNAQHKGTLIQLNWTTINEDKINKFDIEQSIDGIHFIKIGELKANNKPSNYIFTDNTPPQYNSYKTSNFLYFRLKIVDFDDKITFSKIISMGNKSVLNTLKVYPNPVLNELNIEHLQGDIDIINVLRQVVLHQNNTTLLSVINVQHLKSGIYFLKSGDSVVRFVKN